MQYRRFRAPDMQKAIRKIRDAVGPDAVIMSNKRLSTGEVEIVIAIDYDPSAVNNNTAASAPAMDAPESRAAQPSESYQERIEQARNLSGQPAPTPAPKKGEAYEVFEEAAPAASKPAKNRYFDVEAPIKEDLSIRPHTEQRPSPDEEKLRAMEKELEQVREMLLHSQAQQEQVAVTKSAAPKTRTPADKLHEQLATLGLSDKVIEKISADLALTGREEDWKKALSHLADSIPIRTNGDAFNGCIAFMGPTGVGKTTSIGKIAAQYVLKYGSDSVVLITTDTYRIAAHEQLRTFGRILNVPVEVVSEYSDLNEVLDKYSNYSLILVDTAGMNPRDRNLERQLAMMKRARGYLKKLLVLPCTSQRQVLKTVVDVYSQIQLDGCVLSKLDESASLGEAISVVIEEGLPVMYVADGQRIPDDIEPARAHNLISRAVYTAEQFGQLYGSLKYGS
ncbi:flagellar biosynthesis protein FlhF [Marinomonas ostreistagni]|uniref:flagellar biosynthesis protein FlhF n=1 Tax=Marinomonas ostreistagni TaxID=359209 RepID=UPI0019501EDC|nr:flagellar biosynthesis protein FlhF [Marinomonas ostreistagni]MBM6551261.1 flagellar biosynthesis protein FlhF [Marinomonas ostreistagni]